MLVRGRLMPAISKNLSIKIVLVGGGGGGFFVVVADAGVGCERFEFAFPCRPLPPGALAQPRKPLPTDI